MIIFFFLILRRPPRSTRTATLFPYTTLFRSLRAFHYHLIANELDELVALPPEYAFASTPKTTSRLWSGIIVRSSQEVRRSEEHTSELQSLMRISYAVFCLKKKKYKKTEQKQITSKVTYSR